MPALFQNQLPESDLFERARRRSGEDVRGHYFRDATAIIHSTPFRRMKRKTQVFLAPSSEHICTRIEHTLHVATIAATICRALDLDGDLAWAVGLGHDIGHTPFGHQGEKVLSKLRGIAVHHELYALRVVDVLAGRGRGLNLSYAVRDGIATHCGERFDRHISADHKKKKLEELSDLSSYPATWEGCAVRVADSIAYLARDFEDALRLKIISVDDLPDLCRKKMGATNSAIIDACVRDIVAEAERSGKLGYSDEMREAFIALKDFNYDRIYNPLNELAGNYVRTVLETVWKVLTDAFDRFSFDVAEYRRSANPLLQQFGIFLEEMKSIYEKNSDKYEAVFDYIAGMTDDFAQECVRVSLFPKVL